MHFRALKYLMVFSTVGFSLFSILSHGAWVYSSLIYAFGFIPLVELFLKPDPSNLNKAELEMVRNDRLYDLLVYLVLPVQFGMVILFLFKVSEPGLLWWETLGLIWALGISCGALGINVAHELGHRHKKYEQVMAKMLLLTSLYMHFFIEHNRGHHARVSTHEDPASSRRGEIIYTFWVRSIVGSWKSAWHLENERLRRKGKPVFSLQNEMVVYQLIQGVSLLLIGLAFGGTTLLYFMAAAGMGILFLETVNYIEHYGLQRQQLPDGRYERVQPVHSWNSNHTVGRLLLFELSRHSDHHYRAGRKYQVLRHMEGAPQMPTGYPGMMLLSLVPPLWFGVMHPLIDNNQYGNAAQTSSAIA